MKKKIIIGLLVGMFLIIGTLASAGLLDDLYDSIKSKVSLDNKQIIKIAINNTEGEKVVITHKKNADKIIWGAYVPNVINTQDNVLQRYWMNCTITNGTTGECETEIRINYTLSESMETISNDVSNRLNAFAESIKPEYDNVSTIIVDLD